MASDDGDLWTPALAGEALPLAPVDATVADAAVVDPDTEEAEFEEEPPSPPPELRSDHGKAELPRFVSGTGCRVEVGSPRSLDKAAWGLGRQRY